MTDLVDIAQQREDQHRALALLEQSRRPPLQAEYDAHGFRVCVDCNTRIPHKRTESVDAIRCMDCQTLVERQLHKKGERL